MVEYLGNGEWGLPAGETPPGDPGSIALAEALEKWDLVDVSTGENPYVIMTERGYGQYLPIVSHPDTRKLAHDDVMSSEIGTASPSPWTSWLREEHVPSLRGEQGLHTYLKMKRSSSAVRSSLRLFKTPIVGARWYIQPGADGSREVKLAERVSQMLFHDMSHSWPQMINEILLLADYGHSIFEKVWTEYDDGFLGWQKLAPRHPLDVQEWIWDKHGGIAGIKMKSETVADGKFIPIDKLLIFTMDLEVGDLRGTSLLRSAYKNWYFAESLYKIDAIQKERHGIGIPLIKLPAGFTDADRALAENLGRNLRTNERAHVVLPYNWEITTLKIEGQVVNAMESIEHHNKEIGKNVLAPFIGTDLDDKKQSLFMKSTKYVANTVTEVINRHGIQEIVAKNFLRPPKCPTLQARRIGEWEDLRTLSFALRNLIGAGVIIPDDKLEAAMREEFDLPLADPDTARLPETPQGSPDGSVEGSPDAPKPPRVGPPRQTPTGHMGQGQLGTGSSGRTGLDRSGGK